MNKKETEKSSFINKVGELNKSIKNKSSQLISFQNRNSDTNHINYKIYHLLQDPFTFVNAYVRISKNKGALTKGIPDDEEIMRFFQLSNAEKLAKEMTMGNYQWKPTRRTLIPKPGKNKLRPIDTPTQKDRIVQEAIRGILESIYEPEFRKFEQDNKYICTNYGFRPNKSCWDAVKNLKKSGQSTNYVIEGDIVGAYNNVNHEILLSILQKRIKDKKFLKLIKNLLKTGIMEKDSTYIHNIKGTPQGGIVSPLLFNIYMFEFDKYILYHIINPVLHNNKNKPKKKLSSKYQKIRREQRLLRQELKNNRSKSESKTIKKAISLKTKELFKTPSYNISTLPKKPVYVRYADDWVLLINSSRKEALEIKERIKYFILSKLEMELDEDKTLINKFTDGFNFLGYNLRMSDHNSLRIKHTITKIKGKYKRILRRTTSRKIIISPDKQRLLNKLIINQFCNNKFYPIAKRSWHIYDEYEIVLKYKQVMLGLYNYYSQCDRTYLLNRISYILQYSCAKTISTRKKLTMPKIFKRYGTELKISKTFYINGKPKVQEVKFDTFTTLKSKQKLPSKITKDLDPFNLKEFWRTKIKLYYECCICGSYSDIGLHHINSLRSIKHSKRDKFEYLRNRLKRLQIPVCKNCHVDITNGKYDKDKPIKFYNEFIAKY